MYGMPDSSRRRIVKFDTVQKTLVEIGPDLGLSRGKWRCGILSTNDSCIYCPPYDASHLLKINTTNDEVMVLTDVELPEEEMTRRYLWQSGVIASDHCLYFMPFNAHWILKFDPAEKKACSIGTDLIGRSYRYSGTIVGRDGFIYGIPHLSNHFIKIDPQNPDIAHDIGERNPSTISFGKGILANDGYIYSASFHGQVLKIIHTGTSSAEQEESSSSTSDKEESYTWIGERINSDRLGWGDPVIGIDKCIYWPPTGASHVLKYDPCQPQPSQGPVLVGEDLGEIEHKWYAAVMASNGDMYCIPNCAEQILVISPMRELVTTMKRRIQTFPETFGNIFERESLS